ncbi:hypothetical protein CFIO01_10208 [Colletotrichum fioriniae PJ7]|uniref:Uncharacterized protein n=1 Tax=Colletotrichum fioriniae PJ7 TaxID=1445577 RepID=A0A010Q3R4_9PEZI|nr:hypothetical protein CFIO01_10208 [Colletotrichum fioriniae PJ7]
MGAAHEDAHALNTAAAKPSAAATPSRLDKAATLPFELVLNIMGHAILEAESDDCSELNWNVARDDSQALGVSFIFAEFSPSHGYALQRRFNGIRTLLQTNRKIRSMILGKSYFLCPQAQEWDEFSSYVSSNYVLINPKKDCLMVVDNRVWDAVGHPRAALKPLVERISKVFIGDGSFFTPSNSSNVEILKSLPSLRRVDLDIGKKRCLCLMMGPEDGLVELAVGSGNWRIHSGLFPDLAEWAERNKSTFPTIWQPFKERGVSLLGWKTGNDWCWDIWKASKEVWLNTSSDGIFMNLCEGSDYYYCD